MTAANPLGGAPIGRVVGTERKPNTPHEFHFWTGADASVGIGTLVKVAGAGVRPVTVHGIVVDLIQREARAVPAGRFGLLVRAGLHHLIRVSPTRRYAR